MSNAHHHVPGKSGDTRRCRTGGRPSVDAPEGPYERLLGDALRGDTGLFTDNALVAAGRRVIDPVLGSAELVEVYEPGTWGAASAAAVVTDERGWHDPTPERSAPC